MDDYYELSQKLLEELIDKAEYFEEHEILKWISEKLWEYEELHRS